MVKWLIAAIIVIPAVEFWGIIQVGNRLGGWTTCGILLFIGFFGGYLALAEGRKVWVEAQRQLQQGIMPGIMMLDGLCVLLGGVLLFIPGFFSDVIGFTLLFPFTRPIYRGILLKWLEKKMRNGSFIIRR